MSDLPFPAHMLANQDPETLRIIAAAYGGNADDKSPRNEHEHEEQVSLFQWAKMQECIYPELEGLFAVPNGGDRNPAVAGKLKAEGVKAGVLDVWLPVARGEYHGLVIEMKYGRNKPTKDQEWWIEFLKTQNYLVSVCYSWTDAKDLIVEYLTKER